MRQKSYFAGHYIILWQNPMGILQNCFHNIPPQMNAKMERGKGMPRLMLAVLLVSCWLNSQAQTIIPLWPDSLPNSKGLEIAEVEENQRTRLVKYPTLTVFTPNQEHNTGQAVIICPGGGYRHLAIHKEGYQIAKWLNTLGITAFVLKYRLPHSEDLIEAYKAPLQDAQRAIKLIRGQAKTWKIDPNQIGMIGFSAGGHLVASAGTHFHEDWSKVGDEWDAVSCRPDFMMLMYPVISLDTAITKTTSGSGKNLLGSGDANTPEMRAYFSLEKQVSSETPPTFIALAGDDRINPQNSIQFFSSLQAKGVAAALHVFHVGGHGFGLGEWSSAPAAWKDLCAKWLLDLQLKK